MTTRDLSGEAVVERPAPQTGLHGDNDAGAPAGATPGAIEADGLLPCEAALRLVLHHAGTVDFPVAEFCLLGEAANRVLAEDLRADRDQPAFPRSTRDGYAIQSADLVTGNALQLMGGIRAGEQWSGLPLGTGQAIEIMTGAPVPAGADAILMVEHGTVTGSLLQPAAGRRLRAGENIVPQGAEARQGDTVLRRGTRLGPADVALAACIGAATVPVFTRPTVAILATGDELVALDAIPGPMQIRNSNSHALAALVCANGGVPQMLPPAADTREALHAAILGARDATMLLLSGGVSAGKYDFVEEVLLALGGEFFFTGVRMQPGKPAVFGRLPATEDAAQQWFFGLPGNPVSTEVTATLFAMPLLRALGGDINPGPRFSQATLGEAVEVKPGVTRFLPARTESSLAGATVRPTGWQGSGDLHSNARANGYLVLSPDRAGFAPGEVVTVLLR